MNEQNRKQVIMLGGVGVLLVAVLAYQFLIAGGSSKTPQKITKKTATENTAIFREVNVNPTEMMKIVTFKPPKYTQGRNPMEPMALTPTDLRDGIPVVDTQEVRDMIKNVREKSVSAIIYDNVRPMAVIDDEIVEVGYVYSDGMVKVHAIEPNRVIFEVDQMLVPVDMKEL